VAAPCLVSHSIQPSQITMADEKNKKPLTMEELRAKVDKIAATMLPVLHPDLQRIVEAQ
jgi:hypothetical protein